jgi:hypothetical protein
MQPTPNAPNEIPKTVPFKIAESFTQFNTLPKPLVLPIHPSDTLPNLSPNIVPTKPPNFESTATKIALPDQKIPIRHSTTVTPVSIPKTPKAPPTAPKPQSKHDKKHATFTKEEDAQIIELFEEYGTHWKKYQDHFPNRTALSIRQRWSNNLDPNINKAPFSPQEDEIILTMQKSIGNKWSSIAEMLEGRSQSAVSNRFTALTKKTELKKEVSEFSSGKKRSYDETEDYEPPSKIKKPTQPSSKNIIKLEDEYLRLFESDAPGPEVHVAQALQKLFLANPGNEKIVEEDDLDDNSAELSPERLSDTETAPPPVKTTVKRVLPKIEPRFEVDNDTPVSVWLKSLKLEKFTSNFEKVGLRNVEDVLNTNIDLTYLFKLGITQKAYRILILEEIEALKDETQTIEAYLKFHKWTWLAVRFKELGIDDIEVVKRFGKARIFALVTGS